MLENIFSQKINQKCSRVIVIMTDNLKLMYHFIRYDETVRSINTGTLVQTSKSSKPSGQQHLRELVNPNILQAAPQVSVHYTYI